MNKADSILIHALAMAGRGWSVFRVNGKHPLKDTRGVLDATADARRVREWFSETNGLGIGIATGDRSGFWALDIDSQEGEDQLAAWEIEYGELPQTIEVETHKGRHIYFAMNGQAVRNSTSKVAPGIDVRGTGGYVVAPPSPHPDGGSYTWAVSPKDREPADPPEWLLRMVVGQGPDRAPRVPPETEGTIPEHTRNTTLTSIAGKLRRPGLSTEALHAALQVENERCDPPLEDDEVRRIAESVGRYEPAPEQEHRTDLGNAERLVRLYGADLRFCERLGGWFPWDGTRWAKDELRTVDRLARNTVRSMYAEASRIEDQEERERLSKWANRSEAEARLKAMVNLAEADAKIIVAPNVFDRDAWKFNVRNGTVDLRTGNLLPHSRDDLITKRAPVEYDPDAKAPTFERFLAEVLKPEVGAYLQRCVGLSMVGEVLIHLLLFLHGLGANGKTTFLSVIQNLFGDYGKQADPDLLLMRRSESHPTGVADLVGSRLVVTTEVADGRRLAEALVKQLTGGDRVKARFLFRDFFEFEPTWTIWMAANHKPGVKGTDEGIWRRIKLIPFTVTIPAEDRDPELAHKLTRELPGILNWAIEGCLAFRKSGLQDPPAVLAATNAYRMESDALTTFFEEETDTGPNLWGYSTELFKRYGEFCERTGERRQSQNVFGRILVDRGYTKDKHPDKNDRRTIYLGICLKNLGVKGSETLRTDFPKQIPHVEKYRESLSPPFTSSKDGLFDDSGDAKSERVEDDYEKIEREAIQAEDAA